MYFFLAYSTFHLLLYSLWNGPDCWLDKINHIRFQSASVSPLEKVSVRPPRCFLASILIFLFISLLGAVITIIWFFSDLMFEWKSCKHTLRVICVCKHIFFYPCLYFTIYYLMSSAFVPWASNFVLFFLYNDYKGNLSIYVSHAYNCIVPYE